MSYASCCAALQAARASVARLERDRDELAALAAEVRAGEATFSRQVAGKRASAGRARQLARSTLAARFGERYLELTGGAFQEGVHAGFAGALREIARAAAEVEAALAAECARVASSERTLELLRARERTAARARSWPGVSGGAL